MIKKTRDYVSPGIRKQMLYYPEIGVCVVFRDNIIHGWSCTKLADSDYAAQRIDSLFDSGKYSDFERDYLIINDKGEILMQNIDCEVSLDANGYIHIDNSKYIIKPVLDTTIPQYVGGRNLTEINSRVRQLIAMDLMKKPKSFGKNGFKIGPIYESSQMEG